MDQIEAHRHPHYPPTARLAILELRAARGWTLAQTARIFLVSPLTLLPGWGVSMRKALMRWPSARAGEQVSRLRRITTFAGPL